MVVFEVRLTVGMVGNGHESDDTGRLTPDSMQLATCPGYLWELRVPTTLLFD